MTLSSPAPIRLALSFTAADGQVVTQQATVEISADLFTARSADHTISVPLSSVLTQWATLPPQQPLVLSLAPRAELATGIHALLKDEWVARHGKEQRNALKKAVREAGVPSTAQLRMLWAAQGSPPVVKRPRAALFEEARGADGWTLYKGSVHRIESLGDILSSDVIAILDDQGKLRLYQTEEETPAEYVQGDPPRQIRGQL